MAFASVCEPVRPRTLLRGPDGRFAKRAKALPADTWTADDLLREISEDVDRQEAVSRPELPPEPLLPAADRARAIHLRRQLEAAAEHGAALLATLGLPRLVGPDTIFVDPVAAGDALDQAIAALDALDADPDLEPYLGWAGAGTGRAEMGDTFDREDDAEEDEDDGTGEATLGAPERHPEPCCLGARYYKPATGERLVRSFYGRAWNQAAWAQGQTQDGEGESEPGYDLPEGDDEKCGSEHDGCEPEEQEDSLGSPIGDGDQQRWAQGVGGDREADRCDGPGLALTAEQRQASRDFRPELHRLAACARDLRWRTPAAKPDPDTVTPIGRGMVAWRGPVPFSICNVTPVGADFLSFRLTELRELGA